jgi:putative ABC transport system ATP-binding protein
LSGSVESFIVLENLSKSYLEGQTARPVLRQACASFAKGEFVAILGKSGSGKSTLLNLISGIDLPDSGSIFFNGQNLTAMNELRRTIIRRAQIGFIFQFFNLLPTLTVLENVSLPLELNGITADRANEKARSILSRLDLLERADSFPEKLSGGEQQRIALARAIIHDPLIVLADEPTGNLDETTGNLVLGLLDQLTRRSGKNLLLVTHNADAAALADRVLILQDGTLTEPEPG